MLGEQGASLPESFERQSQSAEDRSQHSRRLEDKNKTATAHNTGCLRAFHMRFRLHPASLRLKDSPACWLCRLPVGQPAPGHVPKVGNPSRVPLSPGSAKVPGMMLIGWRWARRPRVPRLLGGGSSQAPLATRLSSPSPQCPVSTVTGLGCSMLLAVAV